MSAVRASQWAEPAGTSSRLQAIPSKIGSRPFDLIVIGAGVNGAGIARDAAMRGLKVLLLDKGDLGGGTTDASTRLIHGGLRYLEYYEFGLVRESLRERERLLHIAPHLVHPLGFLVPIYTGWRRGPSLIRLGMLFYDVLSYDRSLPRHRMLSHDETLRSEPSLNPEGLRAAAFYYDAQVDYPERLTVENALSARDHGATLLTYTKVERLLTAGNRVVGVAFSDLLSSPEQAEHAGRDHPHYEAHAPLTINAAGPWVDEVLAGLGRVGAGLPTLIGGTKGSHIVVEPFPGAPREALYVEAQADGRPYFIVPWTGRYLIGTTDLRYHAGLDQVVPDESEIEYLINETNRVIPGAGLTREKVRFAYAGVRPLPYQEAGTTSGITRRHIIVDHAEAPQGPALDGLVSIVGGKITTYRELAEEVTNLAFEKLGRRAPHCLTGRVPLPGGNTPDFARFAARFTAKSGFEEAVANRLLHLYGRLATEVLRLAEGDPMLRQVFSPDTGAIGAEIPYAFRWEQAETLTDALARRTMVGLDSDVGQDAVAAAARIAQATLGWDDARAAAEISAYQQYIQRFRPQEPMTAT